MLAQNWIVFLERKLIWGVHGILLGVILANTGFLRNQTDEFALSIIFLCHNVFIVAQKFFSVNLESPDFGIIRFFRR